MNLEWLHKPLFRPQDCVTVSANPCLDRCHALCCRNMMFPVISANDLAKLTPDGTNKIKLKTIDDVSYLFSEARYIFPGVYYTPLGEAYSAFISGACPNLKEDNTCGAYDNRPIACRNFPVGGRDCTSVRKANHLKPVRQFIPLDKIA